MTTTQSSGQRGMLWAILGGVVLIVGIVAIIIGALVSQGSPSAAPRGTATKASPHSTPGGSDQTAAVVDPTANSRGWRAEPITTNPETYIRAALEAASTFDTQKSTRDAWLSYLDAWFTPDTRYAEPDRAARMKASQLEMREGVVLPQSDWDSLMNEKGRVVAKSTGQVTFVPVTQDPSGQMRIGTTDVTLTYSRSDGSGGTTSYDEHVRVSVQVLCGSGSVPTPKTAQQAGDCKVVRYFTEPMEP